MTNGIKFIFFGFVGECMFWFFGVGDMWGFLG
ncbi:MAG: hypothetical protein BTN85_0836 [Candidatus Methanohalarchaeum thermophilum]|uniref:Uncharacterized protein n=1 Tax=Methanohalarchaeum thermophilum TaxID=1903181 RepID=A0A1Q6DVG9_METT1|nr:MAG: hypothetical protein BTN85_0836 [Candidatus Methanohalarchaeum thermophilum]